MLFALSVPGAFSSAYAGTAGDLHPDMIVRESDLRNHDHVSDGDRVLLRFANGTPSIGAGALHVFGACPPIRTAARV